MGRAFTELLLLLRLLTTITTSVCCVPVHMVSTKRLIPNATNKPVVFVRGAATVHHHDQKHQVAMSGTLAENALGVGPSSKGRPPLSNEEPTEIEHQEWVKTWTNTLRYEGLLLFAESADPPVSSEYEPKTAIVEPEGASDVLKASIAVKNAEVMSYNARLTSTWKSIR